MNILQKKIYRYKYIEENVWNSNESIALTETSDYNIISY